MAVASSSRGSSSRQDPRILFLHIPETAGMTIHSLFIRNYRGQRILNTGVKDITVEEWQSCLDRIGKMPPEELAGYRVIKGHMIFGLHKLLPGPAEYITFLSDPVKRIVSHYKRIRHSFPDKHMLDSSKPMWNLEDYPAFYRSLDNYQVRSLAGIDFELPFGACTQEHLRLAKANMDNHFKFVGLTDRFDLSLMLMRHVCGWRRRYYVQDNGAGGHVTIPVRVLDELRDLNPLDHELYLHAQEKFHRLTDKYGTRLHVETEIFQFGNRMHYRLHRARHAIKRLLGLERRPAIGG